MHSSVVDIRGDCFNLAIVLVHWVAIHLLLVRNEVLNITSVYFSMFHMLSM